jgi:hypothetical protein
MVSPGDEVIKLAGGDIVMWSDSGTLHMKCITKHGDPVELNAEEVIALVKTLQECLGKLD